LTSLTLIAGRIVGHNGTSPGPAAGITYTIEAIMPDGGSLVLENQVPGIERETFVDVKAVEAERPVYGILNGFVNGGVGYIAWLFREMVYWGECGEQPAPVEANPDFPHLTDPGMVNASNSAGAGAADSFPGGGNPA
jgi:hypothetical protein